MATLIKEIISPYSSPRSAYRIYVDTSRNGANVIYTFTAQFRFITNSGADGAGYLGTGAGCHLIFRVYLGDSNVQVTLKPENVAFDFGAGVTISASVSVTLNNPNGSAVLAAVEATSSYFTSGTFGPANVSVPAVSPYYTDPTPPTNVRFTAGLSSSNYMCSNSVYTVEWSAGQAGTNNPIQYYEFGFAEKSPKTGNVWSDYSRWGHSNTANKYSTTNIFGTGTTLRLRITAVGKYSNASYYSDYINCTDKPKIASIATVPPINTAVVTELKENLVINWTAESFTGNPIDHFEIKCSEYEMDTDTWLNKGTVVNNIPASARSHTIAKNTIMKGV